MGCGCECCHGGFCGGCGHAGCGGRRASPARGYGANAPAHLRYTLTSRGFMHMPELLTHAHGALHLSESSSAEAPFVWLRASVARSLSDPLDRVEVVLHVSLDDLAKFVEQCQFTLDHHYQVVPRSKGGLTQ